MQTYRIRVINKKQINMAVYKLLVVLVVISTIIFGQGIFLSIAKDTDINILTSIISEAIPMSAQEKPYNISLGKLIFGFDIGDPVSIIENHLGIVSAEKDTSADNSKDSEKSEIPANANKIAEVKISSGSKNDAEGVVVKNNTTYQFNASELLNEKLNFNVAKKGPKVLIVHSHTCEAYTPTNKDYYLPTDPDRTEDKKYNVVREGKEIADALTETGIEVIHDTTTHDYPSYNGSYKNSLATVEKYLNDYPSIKIVLDVHRDAMVQQDKTKLKVCTEIDGKKAAQVMLVTGTDQGGLYHPNWRENLKFAMKLQRRINLLYPTLTRPIELCKERYNTHTTTASIIVEVGSTGNTLDEAILSGHYIGKALGDMMRFIK